MYIYYIANKNHTHFMYVCKYDDRYVLQMKPDLLTPFSALKHALAAWYSPITETAGTSSKELPVVTSALMHSTEYCVFSNNLVTGAIKRAVLPVVLNRTLYAFPPPESRKEGITTNSYNLYHYGEITKKENNKESTLMVTSFLEWDDFRKDTN